MFFPDNFLYSGLYFHKDVFEIVIDIRTNAYKLSRKTGMPLCVKQRKTEIET